MAAAIRQHGMAALPQVDGAQGWRGWLPLGPRPLRFTAQGPQSGQLLLLDALHRRLWLLWHEPASTRARTRY
ncbi:hypothetical protein [Stenotrophomonas sp. YIM B06876]|uniref:hypothetical protein n=1 Tax=Stenotrophomonas sp. YIM B06876 TaxID=3060211 RepID=UPI002739C11C|nr:hypothetical protein [Stenotrophomonas sp. YIM B06876]